MEHTKRERKDGKRGGEGKVSASCQNRRATVNQGLAKRGADPKQLLLSPPLYALRPAAALM